MVVSAEARCRRDQPLHLALSRDHCQKASSLPPLPWPPASPPQCLVGADGSALLHRVSRLNDPDITEQVGSCLTLGIVLVLAAGQQPVLWCRCCRHRGYGSIASTTPASLIKASAMTFAISSTQPAVFAAGGARHLRFHR